MMCWREGNSEGRVVVDENGEGNESNELSFPIGLSFDVEGNVCVVD